MPDNMNDDYSLIDDADELFAPYGAAEDDGAESLLQGLNPEQRQAVTTVDGPLLILAGAGSGKTRVITYRIAYMMKAHNIEPWSILAITFTNKAANEMKERITSLVGDSSRHIWCGTFHSIYARILRRHAELIGYDSNFTILDTDDQIKMIKQVMEDLQISEKVFKPRQFQFEISNAKNHMVSHSMYEAQAGRDVSRQAAAKVYAAYDRLLLSKNAMDFDDILLNMYRLLSKNPDILEFYRNKFRYIMVDEYQDTNQPQYETVMLLAGGHRNICVVGDDDQSIYAFRGADVRMILNFEKDFSDATVIKLEQNYRSTKTILDAANEVISHNRNRTDKALRTEGEEGEKIVVVNTDSGIGEANWTAEMIKRLVAKGRFRYSDIAVLYRMNALSRSIEASLREKTVPFRIYGGTRFYDRKEIKDILCYLRLINDDKDDIALERIINVPRRGIGDTTLDRLRDASSSSGMSMLQVCRQAPAFEELAKAASKLTAFASLIDGFREELRKDEKSFPEFIDMVENGSGIIEEIITQRESKGELIDRVENLKELLSEANEFEKNHRADSDALSDELFDREAEDDAYFAEEHKTADTLEGILSIYLENAALYTEGDNADDDEDYVRLMSIHSAKGLEFGAVFIIGAEETIFPSIKSVADPRDLEEERRLMYVAITRAKKQLFVVLSRQRMLFGQTQCNPPSRFLREIDPVHLHKIGAAREPVKRDAASVSPSRDQARKKISTELSSDYVKKVMRNDKPSGLMPEEIVKGMKVFHNRFGEGVVLKVELVAGDALVTVDFDGMRKNMLAKSAGLKKV